MIKATCWPTKQSIRVHLCLTSYAVYSVYSDCPCCGEECPRRTFVNEIHSMGLEMDLGRTDITSNAAYAQYAT